MEIQPPDGMWNKIEQKMVEKKKIKILNIYRTMAASIALLLATGIGYYIGTYKNKIPKQALITKTYSLSEFNKLKEKHTNKKDYNRSIIKNTNNKVIASNSFTKPLEKKNNEIKNSFSKNPQSLAKSAKSFANINAQKRSSDSENEKVTNLTTNNNEKPTRQDLTLSYIKPVFFNQLKQNIPTMLVYSSKYDKEKYKPNENSTAKLEISKNVIKWSLGWNIAPMYANRNIENNKTDKPSSFYYNDETPMLAYAGGLYINCSKSRWSLESGIYYSQSGMRIENVTLSSSQANKVSPITSSDGQNSLSNNTTSSSLRNSIGIIENSSNSSVTTLMLSNTSRNPTTTEYNSSVFALEQQFRYIEIPVTVVYKLINRRINVNIAGGLGANFLVGNNVYSDLNNKISYFGTTVGIEKINYFTIVKTTIGIPFSSKFCFEIEPRFSYSLNSLNIATKLNIYPYSFGVFTGLNYKF
jgi:hypothetical protein